MANIKDIARRFSFFLISRHPFINALTFLMLLAERADYEKLPPIEPKMIYANIGVFVICGIAMSFNFARQQGAMLHVGQLLYLAYTIYTEEKMRYRRWITVRICNRILGVAGIMLLYAFFHSPKPRNQQMRRFGETLIGLYLISLTYALVEGLEDRRAFFDHLYGGETALYIYAVFLAACALCYLSGLFVHDICQLLIVLVFVYTIFIDLDVPYWTKKRGVHFWMQIRLITDHTCILLGLIMCTSCTKKSVHTKDD